MLYVFSGGNTVRVRSEAHTFLDTYEEKGIRVEYIGPELCSEDFLRDRVSAQSLFGGTTASDITLFDTPSEKAGALDALLVYAEALAQSDNVFVVIEQKLLAAPTKILKAHAEKFIEIKDAAEGERFNVFALADALARRDKKALWVLLQQAVHAGISAEELSGTLMWQIKSMRLAARTQTAEEAGLKPFVYTKAKRATAKFTHEEIDTLGRSLIALYHDARLGKRDMDIALERFVLAL